MNRTDNDNMSGHTPPSRSPRQARVSSRTSGEGPSITVAAVAGSRASSTSLAGQLIRHNLVAPEKKTLKRIEALRTALARGVDDRGFAVDLQGAPVTILQHLRADRGLAGALADDVLLLLAEALFDVTQRPTAAATIVGRFLRATGGIQHSAVTPERVKAALGVVNEAIYDLDHPHAPIPAAVREVKIEKRDGGLQLVATLRQGADDTSAITALRGALRTAGFADIDIRTERPVVVVAAPKARTSASW